MNDLLLRALGVRSDEAGSVVGIDFELHPAVGWGFFVVLAALALAVAAFSYFRSDVELTPFRRRVLMTFRVLALLGIAGVLLRPSLGLNVEGVVRQSLILLLDQSASLALRDPRTEPADQTRAAI